MTTRTALWQALADALDDRETATLSGGSTTTAVSLAWVTTATGVTSSRYEGRWLFNQTKATQSKVITYVASTGTNTVAPAVTAAASSDVVSLTSLAPVVHVIGSETDYCTWVDRALGRMGLRHEIEIPIVAGQDVYPLTAFPSLDRPERLVQVREPSPVSTRTAPVHIAAIGWELVSDPPVASLRTRSPFDATSGSMTVERIVPANRWIKLSGGGSYTESAVGLAAEGDEAYPSVEEFLPFGLAEALPVLIARSPGRPNAEWERLLKGAEDDVARSRYRDLTQEMAASAPQQEAAA